MATIMNRFIALGRAIILAVSVPSVAFASETMRVPLESAAVRSQPTWQHWHPATFFWDDQGVTQPVSIVISIPTKRPMPIAATRGGGLDRLDGKDGKDTPVGTFPILHKEEMHDNNLYASAPMPFMQGLTWESVAINAGTNPGFAASHGCVRVRRAFAKKLFAVTTLDIPVMVTDASARDGFVPPVPHDPAEMKAATADANAAQFDAIMSDMNR